MVSGGAQRRRSETLEGRSQARKATPTCYPVRRLWRSMRPVAVRVARSLHPPEVLFVRVLAHGSEADHVDEEELP